jgi:hypothetical protein
MTSKRSFSSTEQSLLPNRCLALHRTEAALPEVGVVGEVHEEAEDVADVVVVEVDVGEVGIKGGKIGTQMLLAHRLERKENVMLNPTALQIPV